MYHFISDWPDVVTAAKVPVARCAVRDSVRMLLVESDSTTLHLIQEALEQFAGVVVSDVTERLDSEQALRRDRDRLEKMLDAAAEGIVVIDEDGTIAEANDLYAEILGYTRSSEVIGLNVLAYTAPQDRERNVEAIKDCFTRGQIQNFTFSYISRHGVEVPVSLNARVMADDGSGVARVMTLVVDETERRRTESALRAREEELRVARQIQLGLFPAGPPVVAGFDIAGASFPANLTGGDYFDFFPMLDGRVALIVGDASGHGVGPALLSASTRAYLRALALTHRDVGVILTGSNQLLSGNISEDHFVTVFLGCLNPARRRLEYASAGHMPGYVFDSSGAVKARLDSTGLPLGLDATGVMEAAPGVDLLPGDLLFLYSDGIDEACSPHEELFRLPRALDLIRAHRDQPARQIVSELYQAVCDFCYPRTPQDDITAIVVKVLPSSTNG